MKKFKNILNKFLIVMVCAFMILPSCISTVKASENVTVGRLIPNTGANLQQGYNTAWWADGINYIYVNGVTAFCVEPMTIGISGTYTPDSFDQNTQRTLSRIAYYGWDTSAKTDTDYATTQYMIWEALGASISFTGSFGSSYPALKANVQNKINNHGTTPSFNVGNFEINVGDTLTLTDSNGVLSNFHVKSNAGANVSISGNNLNITPDINTPDTITIVLQKELDACVGSTVAYRSGSGQDVGTFKISDPQLSRINVKVNKFGSLSIAKQDDLGNNVPNTSFKLSKNADMSSPIGTYTTGSNGATVVDQLLPATYYVQEVSVPDHLILDSTIRSVEVKPNETTHFIANNNWKRGYIQIVKKDKDTGKTVIKANTTFSIYKNDGTYIQDITTNNNGTAKTGLLLYGDYYLLEKTAPDGYITATDKLLYTISEDGKTYSQEIANKRVSGTIDLTKEDSITGNKPQGDATLKGAVYELKARSPILDPADGSVIYAKDSVVATLTTDENAKASIDNLYLGDYYLKEKTPSNGYTLDPTEYNVSVSYSDQNTSVITKAQTVKEKIIDGDFKITKVIEIDPNHSEITKPEKDAEFIVVLKKYVDQYGSVEEAYKHKDEFSNKEYDLLTTDKDGEATSKKLAYGKYLAQQTKIGDENVSILKDPFEVKIETEHQDTIKYVVSNQKFLSYLQLEKKDAETGKTVTLSKTSFKIYDVDNDKYLSQRVGLIRHDTWKTDETGKVTLPLKVPAGNYRLEEIKAPDGYLINTDKIDFVMKESNVSIVDDEGEPIQIIVFSDSKPTGTTKLMKADKDSLEPLSGVQYRLTAEKDIIDPADGAILYKAGDPVSMDISEDGYYVTNELGEITVSDLPLGSYTWKETKALDGYVQDTNKYTFELKQKDDVQKIYIHEKELTNQKTKIEILKKDVENQALAGAHLRLIDEDGNVIKEWISKKEDMKLEGLLVGGKYTLYEDEAPQGYIISKPLSFTVKNTDSVQKIDMIDAQMFVKKTDQYDKALSGAKLQILSTKTKNIVDEWTSGDKEHTISNLIEGEEYILHEVQAPQGYALANDITFIANDEKKLQSITMVDKQVVIDKTNKTGSSIKNASLQVIDKDNNVVDSWVSNGKAHAVSNLKIGEEYTLQEVEAPQGYVLAKDIQFTVSKDEITQEIVMIDKQVVALKIDEDGKVLQGAKMQVVSTKTKDIVDQWTSAEKEHAISGLVEGNEYILRELEAPEGLELAKDIVFTVDHKKGTQALKMVDKYILSTIQVNKVDSYTKEAVKSKDFMFTAYKDKDCKESLITVNANTKDGTATFELRYGEWWIKETKAPNGYLLSDEIKHVVINKDGVFVNDKKIEAKDSIHSFVYENELLPVIKTGDDTNPLLVLFLMSGSLASMFILCKKRKLKE